MVISSQCVPTCLPQSYAEILMSTWEWNLWEGSNEGGALTDIIIAL